MPSSSGNPRARDAPGPHSEPHNREGGTPSVDPPTASGNESGKRRTRKTKLTKFHDAMDNFGSKKGFALGEFLQMAFDPDTELNPSEKATISKWLSGDTSPGTRPAEIVDKIYHHPFSQRFKNSRVCHGSFNGLGPPRFSPHYLDKYPGHGSYLPSAAGLDDTKLLYNAREGLEEWMARGTLALVDRESATLTDANGGLPRGIGANWDTFGLYDLEENQTKIRTLAPVTWAILTTIAFNRRSNNLKISKSNPQVAGNDLAGPETQDDEEVITEGNDAETENDSETLRNPLLGATMALFMLLVFRNQAVNLFQHILGVFLFACNAPKSVFLVLCRLGITSAHSTVHSMLGRLGKSAYETLAELRRNAFASASDASRTPQEYFGFLFDNINKYRQARKQTVAVKNEMRSGTAATAVVLEDVPPGAFDPGPYFNNLQKQERRNLTLSQLYDDIDHTHLKNAGTAMIMRLLVTHISTLASLSGSVEAWIHANCTQNKLRLRKSRVHPMGTSGIDKSTAAGGSDVLHDLAEQMKLEPSWLEKMLILVCGDWLSVDRLRRAIRFKAKDSGVYEQRRWALPIIQLWHMKWAYLKVLYKVHWSEETGTDVSVNLRHGLEALNRKFNPTKCEFYPGHEGVQAVFDSLVLTGVLTVLQEYFHTEATNNPDDTFTHTLTDLKRLFASGGPYFNCSFDFLKNLAETVYNQYFTTGAYLSAVSMRPIELDEPQMTSFISGFMAQLDLREDQVTAQQLDDQEVNSNDSSSDSAVGSGIQPLTGVPKECLGDMALSNAILLIRDSFWYLEFATAVTEGDIGRVFEIIKVLRFAFWGGGAANYGNELLELACNYFYEYPEDLKTAILNNYLVNTSGLPGHWHELDLLQEHYNLWIKRVFNKKNSGFDSHYLRFSVSVNVTGFGRLRDSLFQMLGLSRVPTGKSFPDYQSDINVLATNYRQSSLLKFEPGRPQSFVATDIFSAGYEKLQAGALSKFLQQTSYDPELIHNALDSEPEVDESEDLELTRMDFPPNPLVLENGVLAAGRPPEVAGID